MRSGSELWERGGEMGQLRMWQWWMWVMVLGGVVVEARMGRVLLSAKHKFKENENVPLFANKVGPFHNPR